VLLIAFAILRHFCYFFVIFCHFYVKKIVRKIVDYFQLVKKFSSTIFENYLLTNNLTKFFQLKIVIV